MNTDRQRIINFLIEHPDWVDSYRGAFPGRWLTLRWQGESPYVSSYGPTNTNDGTGLFNVPPEGEWRPLPEPQTFESRMVKSAHVSDDSWATPLVRVDERFAGHTVRVTVEAIR